MRARSPFRSVPACGRGVLLPALLALAACTLEPAGTDEQFARLRDAGADAAWAQPPARRELPELPPQPKREDVVARALLANGELEAAWHDWRAALEGVLVASGWPNTDLSVGLTSFVAHGSLWDTSAVSLGFDPMQMLLLPQKVRQAGEVAFEEALATGRRFEAQRLALRAEVLSAWAEWSVLGERLAAQEQDLALLESLERQARAAVGTGAAQAGLLDSQTKLAEARNALATLRADVEGRRAALNALLLRAPDAPLALPTTLPEPRTRPSDADILRAGVAANPELAALAHDAAARGEAEELAGLRWFPNVAPSAQAGGGMDESVSLGFTLPTSVPSVLAALRQAQAQADAANARLRQGEADTRAALASELAALHAEEQVLATLDESLAPAARALADNQRQAYVNGAGGLSELVEAQRALLELRVTRAEAAAARETRLASIERLVGVDFSRAREPQAPLAAVAAQEEP
jgi:outer membrane protein TolC